MYDVFYETSVKQRWFQAMIRSEVSLEHWVPSQD